MSSTSTTNQKTNKKSTNHSTSSSSSFSSSSNQPRLSSSTSSTRASAMDQLIQLMSQVNGAVKNGEFSTHLANQIFSLCQQLKSNGQQLEQTHKTDLNKVFVSLRQACCRDSGQLGTPCRLKIMELIELRAMNWKSSFAHTQYYLNKAEKINGQSDSQSSSSTSTVQSTSNTQAKTSTSHSTYTAPTQQPKQQQSLYQPPQPVNIPAQQFGQNNFAQPPPMYLPAEIAANPQHMSQGAPGYFLIPAASAWSPQMIPTSMLPSPQFGPPMRQHQMQPPPDWMARSAAIAAVSAHFGKLPPNMTQSAYVSGSSANSKSSKQPQFREEVTIRNADSGKIMGVKGRRVAAVEEMSKTVISFQKVDNNSRYRTLAITGLTQESISHAKRLIEDTIKRNVSPNRLEFNGSTSTNIVIPQGKVIGEDAPPLEDPFDDEDDDPGISIETNTDGTLKLSCDDPEMLQAAQKALTEYLSLRTNRMTAEEREQRKERRKSMPLQSSASSVPIPVPQIKEAEQKIETKSNGSLSEIRKKLAGSTPNLLADSLKDTKEDKPLVIDSDVLRYERDKMLSVRDQVKTQLDMWTSNAPTTSSNNAEDDDNLPYTAAKTDEPKKES